MRDLEMLKSQRNTPHVFMNAGGGAGAVASGSAVELRKFPHWIHIILTFVTGILWLPIYVLMYAFRNRRYYY